MAVDVKMSVRREINRLKKSITQKSSELVSLKDELERHTKVHEFLGGNRGRTRRTRGRGKRGATVNWDSALKRLPDTFTTGHVYRASVAKGKSRGYLRQVVGRWAKQRKIKRKGRGKYQKV